MLPTHFVLDDIACSDPDGGTTSTGTTATIDLDDGEAITCTFSNADVRRDLAVAITQSAGPFFPGDAVQYDIVVSNQSSAPASGVALDIALDADLSAVSTSGCAQDPSGVPSCTIGSLAANSQAAITVIAQINAGADDALLSSTEVTSTDPERNDSDNLAFIATAVGDAVGTITVVQNTSPDDPQDFAFSGDLGDFSLDDDADSTLSNVAVFTVAAGSYEVTQAGVTGFRLDALSCTDPDGGTSIGGATATIDLDNGENVQCVFVNVPEVTLNLTAAADTDPVTAGESFSVLVDIDSLGNASGVVLTTTSLPAGVSLASSSGCAESPAGGVPSCTVGSIGSGGNAEVTLVFSTASDLADSSLALDLAVDAAQDLATGSNDAATVSVGLERSFDLSVTITDGEAGSFEGSLVDYTVVVNNAGPSDAVDAVLAVAFDAEHDASSASWICAPGVGATCAASGTGALSDTLTLAAGASATYTLSVNVIDEVEEGDILDAVASIAAGATGSDPDLDNNSDTDSNLLSTSEELEDEIFADGFEGDAPMVLVSTTSFATQSQVLVVAPDAGSDRPVDWAQLGDTSDVGRYLLQVMAGEGHLWMRGVAQDELGRTRLTTPWMAVSHGTDVRLSGHPDSEISVGIGNQRTRLPGLHAMR